MEVDDKVEIFNPWKVEDIDQFLNYCCPECDSKEKTKSAFIIHATEAHPKSCEYLPLFDFNEDKDTLKTKHSASNGGGASVKLEPLTLNSLLKMECDEDDCGRFFVTQESMLEHKRQFHRKLTRKVKKPKKFDLDYVEDIEPSELEYVSTLVSDFHQDDDSALEPQEDSKDVFPDEEREMTFEEKPKVSRKRKLTDSDDEYDKPICKKCDQKFPTQSAFNAHKKSVHSSEPKEAKKRTGRPSKYFQEIDPTDGKQKYKCDECPIFFNSIRGLSHHKKSNHSNDQVMQKCFLCAEAFPPKLMCSHLIRTHVNSDGVFECHLCSKLFKKCNPEQFMYHLTKEHKIGEFRYKCDQCDIAYWRNYELENHKKIQHEKSCSVICDQCGKKCLSKGNLESHLKSVHHAYKISKEDTLKKCEKCHIEFEKPEEFNDHLKNCLDQMKDFECKICDSSWVSHLSLWQHIAVDHKMIRFVCDICGHVLTSKAKLQDHRNHVHFKAYDFVCHICALPKHTKAKLEEHMIITHGQGERKFKCDLCDSKFTNKHILKQHVESHHAKNTLFKCEQCPKTFWMKSYLKTHVRMMHENYRPHKCDICQEGFVYKRDVIKHKKSQHNIHE